MSDGACCHECRRYQCICGAPEQIDTRRPASDRAAADGVGSGGSRRQRLLALLRRAIELVDHEPHCGSRLGATCRCRYGAWALDVDREFGGNPGERALHATTCWTGMQSGAACDCGGSVITRGVDSPAAASIVGEFGEVLRSHTIVICQKCYDLEGHMCHTPECVFCRRSMSEVAAILDTLLIRPLIDGERLKL